MYCLNKYFTHSEISAMLHETVPKKQRWPILSVHNLCFGSTWLGSDNKGIHLCILKVHYNTIVREVYFVLINLVSFSSGVRYFLRNSENKNTPMIKVVFHCL